jgi:glycosyltransferase involved in cell wall biosynthesis
MRILWLTGLPYQVQREALQNEDHGARGEGTSTVAHFPPPDDIEVHVACLWPGGSARKDFTYKSVHYHLLPCPRKGRATTFFIFDHLFYKKLFRELKPDIVHAWGTEDSMGLVAERLAPFRHLISTQGFMSQIIKHAKGNARYWITARMERVIIEHARYIAVENEFGVEQARILSGKGKIVIIDHPLRHDFLTKSPSVDCNEKALFVGRIVREKGYEECLCAFAKAAPPSWKLHVVGSGSPRDEEHLHSLAFQLSIQNRFHHDRHLDLADVITAMQSSSIFLLPTYIEGGCVALKEALTMGLWPVCYDNSGPGVYIRKFKYGSLAKNQNLTDLCNVLGQCISEMPWLDRSRRLHCIEKSRESFHPGFIWQQLRELYSEIIGT